ncbi:hypothetical protein ABFS82_11G127800 [Erythranthe guttata]|uniref:RING-H2 finger protein ATL56-like n=1 Tax=Erythranthe guttata TaxID=4155 RepID=UPI00064E13E9|nr:PREDICTED: RING-H2 finger protein ATL56-like [Erythranthe guttata]|eukprot:XP_012840486.1 PREDICTED: RING-H2 finger protein ATL56-like [Erythranthe guttata]
METVVFCIYLFAGLGLLSMIRHCMTWRSYERRLLSNNNDINMVEMGMSNEDIEKLPHFDFKRKNDMIKGSSSSSNSNSNSNSSSADCAICLDIFDVGEKCRLLPPCEHVFHAECVDLWLLKSPFCPICRARADVK